MSMSKVHVPVSIGVPVNVGVPVGASVPVSVSVNVSVLVNVSVPVIISFPVSSSVPPVSMSVSFVYFSLSLVPCPVSLVPCPLFVFLWEFCHGYFNSFLWQGITFKAYLLPDKSTDIFCRGRPLVSGNRSNSPRKRFCSVSL
jgi:hypothetical protein